MVATTVANFCENISIKLFARFKVGKRTSLSGPETAPVPAPVKV
jgi:hypothetical protein